MKSFETIAGWLLVLGGISIGLEGVVNYDLLGSILGSGSTVKTIVDIAIGVSAVMMGYKMVGKR